MKPSLRPLRNTLRRSWLLPATVLLFTPWLGAQDIHFDLGTATPSTRGEHVTLETDTYTLQSRKPGWIELHFRVAPGFHINSHTPGDETLIPTTFKFDDSPQGHLLHAEFPPGVPYHLQVGEGEILNTYQGDFTIRVELDLAEKGQILLAGKLRYQACDNASCFPPRDLPVRLSITAR